MEQRNTLTQVVRAIIEIVIRVLLYFAVFYLLLVLFSVLPQMRGLPSMILNGNAMLLAGAVLFLTYSVKEKAAFYPNTNCTAYYLVIVLGLASAVVLNKFFTLIPWETITFLNIPKEAIVQDDKTLFEISFGWRLIMYGLCAPFAEEMVFRVTIYGGLRKILPVWVGVIVSAFLFGVYHGNIMQGGYAFLMGIGMALCIEWTQSFFSAFLFHAAANTLVNICYQFKSINNVVYSYPGAVVCALLMIGTIFLLIKQNKCSKKLANRMKV